MDVMAPPKGNLDPVARVSAATTPRRTAKHGASATAKRREIGDFQALDRALAQAAKPLAGTQRPPAAAVPRLSLRRLKKLAEHSWQRDDTGAGWRRELQKNVAACEEWLERALAAAEESVRARFVDDDAYAAHHRARAETQATNQRAKQLQQYFTSDSLVQLVVARLRVVLAELALPSFGDDRVMWLEPSCGDGRIVEALVAAGAKRVIGCELDERMSTLAHDKLRHVDAATIQQGDFLTSEPPARQGGTTVMALGNPPFGSDDVTSGSEGRDLVAKFVVHSVSIWCAQLVAFIVPARCAKPLYLERLLAELNDLKKQGGEAAECTERAWSVVVCEMLEDCTFEFQTIKRVKQPSSFVVLALQSPTE